MDRLINVPLCVLSRHNKNSAIQCKPISTTRNFEESCERDKSPQQFKLKGIPTRTASRTGKYPKIEKEIVKEWEPDDDIYEEWKPGKKKANKDFKPTVKKMDEEWEPDDDIYEEWKPGKKKANKDFKPTVKKMDEEWEPDDDIYEEWKPGKKKANKDFKPTVKEMDEEWEPRNHLSEIEKLALKNKQEHLALLQSLKVQEAKEDFIQAVIDLKHKKKSKSERITPPVLRKSIRLRKSRRLAKLDVNLSEDVLFAKAIKKPMQKAEEKIPPRFLFKDTLHCKEVYEDFDKDFHWASFKNSTYECNLSSDADNRYVSRFPFMKIDESKVAKVVPASITAMAINPLPDRIIVTAADKYGNMGFWKVDSESNPYLFEVHYQNIPHLQYNPVNPNLIFSCSYDGSIRCGDLETRVFDEVYVDKYSGCTYFDFLSPTSLIVGKKTGRIAVVDVRKGNSAEKSHDCHERPIKTVSIHPVNKNYFITAMTLGTVSLWDLRKLQKKPVASITHHKKCASSAYFSPVTGNSILTTSLDNSLCLFDSSSLTESLPLKKSVSHNNFTGRWLSVFRATWLPETDDVFVVGSMNPQRRIEIFNDNMENIYNFIDENLSSVTSVNKFHPSLPVLAGGSVGGKVFAFVDSQ